MTTHLFGGCKGGVSTVLQAAGAMLCLLGLLFPPILIIGLVPLYFGLRKLAAVRLGIKSLEKNQASEELL
jgi:hypothetical protein